MQSGTDPVIHRATHNEAAACAAMVNTWIDATGWHPRVHSHTAVVSYYQKVVWPECDVFVAGTPPLGFIALTDDDYVSALYAAPAGDGIGTALMRHAQSLRRQLSLWTHVPNTNAQAFYRAMGFVEVRRTSGDNEEGVPDILFHWECPDLTD